MFANNKSPYTVPSYIQKILSESESLLGNPNLLLVPRDVDIRQTKERSYYEKGMPKLETSAERESLQQLNRVRTIEMTNPYYKERPDSIIDNNLVLSETVKRHGNPSIAQNFMSNKITDYEVNTNYGPNRGGQNFMSNKITEYEVNTNYGQNRGPISVINRGGYGINGSPFMENNNGSPGKIRGGEQINRVDSVKRSGFENRHKGDSPYKFDQNQEIGGNVMMNKGPMVQNNYIDKAQYLKQYDNLEEKIVQKPITPDRGVFETKNQLDPFNNAKRGPFSPTINVNFAESKINQQNSRNQSPKLPVENREFSERRRLSTPLDEEPFKNPMKSEQGEDDRDFDFEDHLEKNNHKPHNIIIPEKIPIKKEEQLKKLEKQVRIMDEQLNGLRDEIKSASRTNDNIDLKPQIENLDLDVKTRKEKIKQHGVVEYDQRVIHHGTSWCC